MNEQINNRRRFYGEVKGWPSVFAKIHPDVLRILNRYRGSKSWSRFLEDVAVMLDSQPEKS